MSLSRIFASSPKKGVNSSRNIQNTRGEQVLLPKGASQVLQNKGQVLAQPFRPDQNGGRQIGKGEYGTAYSMKVTPAIVSKFQNILQYGKFRVGSTLPKVGDTIVVKVAKPHGNNFFEDSVKENVVHQTLSRGSGVVICGKPVRASVPGFYFSAYDGKNYITVMSMARGMAARKYIAKFKPSARGYVKLEKAVASLWLAGYLHGDFHTGNWLADEAGNVEILDFGFAIVLPQGLRDKLTSAIQSAIQAGAKSFATLGTPLGVEDYSNRTATTMGLSKWRHSDFRALAADYNRLSAKEKALVPDLRRQYWGCPASASTTATLPPMSFQKAQTSPTTVIGSRSGSKSRSRSGSRSGSGGYTGTQYIGTQYIGTQHIGTPRIGSQGINHPPGSSPRLARGQNNGSPISFTPATFKSIENNLISQKNLARSGSSGVQKSAPSSVSRKGFLPPVVADARGLSSVERMRRFRQLFQGSKNKIPHFANTSTKVVNLVGKNGTIKRVSIQGDAAKRKYNDMAKKASKEKSKHNAMKQASREKSKHNAMKHLREKSKRNEAMKQASREKSKRNDTARRASQIKKNETMKRFELRRNASQKKREQIKHNDAVKRRMSHPMKDPRSPATIQRLMRERSAKMKAISPSAPPLTQSQYIRMTQGSPPGKSNPRKSSPARTQSQIYRDMKERHRKNAAGLSPRPTAPPTTHSQYMNMARRTAEYQRISPKTRKLHVPTGKTPRMTSAPSVPYRAYRSPR